MPIRPENKDRYQKNWKEISNRIRGRAENRCEWCGVKNGYMGFRDVDGRFIEILHNTKPEDYPHTKIIKIVLTVAHLNHKPEDCRDENLKALCQRCHNKYDAPYRVENRRKRLEKERGQLYLFEVKSY